MWSYQPLHDPWLAVDSLLLVCRRAQLLSLLWCVMPWMQHFTSLLSFSSSILSALFFTVFSDHRGGGTDTLFNAKYPVLVIQASWTVPSLHTRNTHAEQRNFSVWDEVCRVEKASGTPYLRTVGVLAAWRQKLTATFSLLTSFLHKVYRKKAELSYRQICQHLCEGSWHFKNTWLWIVLKY